MVQARILALESALRDVGVHEMPPGSNWGQRVAQYLRAAGINSPAPWCAAFVTYHLRKVGYEVTTPNPASVENWVVWARKHGDLVARPFRGDLVCYDWNADNWYDHIGFVVRVLALRWKGKTFAGLVRTVEGNAEDAVRIKHRWIRHARFLRLPGW